MTPREYRAMTDAQIQNDDEFHEVVEPLNLTGDYRISLTADTSSWAGGPCVTQGFSFTPGVTVEMRPEMSVWDVTKLIIRWCERFPLLDDFHIGRFVDWDWEHGWLGFVMETPHWEPRCEELAAIDPTYRVIESEQVNGCLRIVTRSPSDPALSSWMERG